MFGLTAEGGSFQSPLLFFFSFLKKVLASKSITHQRTSGARRTALKGKPTATGLQLTSAAAYWPRLGHPAPLASLQPSSAGVQPTEVRMLDSRSFCCFAASSILDHKTCELHPWSRPSLLGGARGSPRSWCAAVEGRGEARAPALVPTHKQAR